MQRRFTFIDGLRGIAAMAVVLFHALRGSHLDNVPSTLVSVVMLGEAGVVIFFVISGFVIAHALADKRITPGGAWLFIAARSIRLDPPYWAAIALAVGFSVLASVVVPGRPLPDYSLGQLVAHLFYLQEILGYAEINPVFWTLCYEIQFYALFAFMLASRSTTVFALTFVLSLLWPLGLVADVRGLFVNFFYSFLLGVGAYYSWRLQWVRPLFLVYAGLILAGAIVHSNVSALISGGTALLLVSVAMANKLQTGLNWRWLQFLGMISYSLYLTHNPITGATFRAVYLIAGRSPLTQMIGFGLSMISSVVFAWLMYVWIEKPSIRLARSSGSRLLALSARTKRLAT
jgi:peptidoglycan/LPS O-acetylase OafA/YrhL